MQGSGKRSLTYVAAAILLAAVLVSAALVLVPLSRSPSTVTETSATTTTETTTSTSTNASSQNTTSSSIQSQNVVGANCIVVVPYDSMQYELGGCGYYISVLYNGCCYAQSSLNGSQEINLGYTLILGVSQSTGPSENATFGWDPSGPSTASGERLPAPVNSTLFNGTLTIEWRLYNSTTPVLYAWIIDSFPVPEQFIANKPSSTSCPTAPWPNQTSTTYQPAVQQIEQDPAFIALMGGHCYSYGGNNSYGTAHGENLTSFSFSEYNGTISYPCGYFPAKLVVSQILVGTVYNADKIDAITAMSLENDLRSLDMYSCPYDDLPLWVHSVTIVPPYTLAGPTIQVTLYASGEQAPITNLTAVLSLTGENQTFEFSGVSASNPLLQGELASQTDAVVGPVSADTTATYPMTIEGSFQDGQAFTYAVTVQVQAARTSEASPG